MPSSKQFVEANTKNLFTFSHNVSTNRKRLYTIDLQINYKFQQKK